MKLKSTLIILIAIVLLVLPTLAQDSDTSDTYDGRFSFTIPQGFRVLESLTNDTIRLERDDDILIIIGPDSYNAVLGEQDFDSDGAELAFYLDRTGYGIIIRDDEGMTFAENVLAFTPVEFERRDQIGTARLLNLENGRRGVLISLSATSDIPDTRLIVDSIVYPPNIVDVIRNADNTILALAAIRATGLDEELVGGDFTVFIPTDEAFDALLTELEYDSIVDLLGEDLDIAEAILRNHIVEGRVLVPDDMMSTFSELDVVVTVDGANIVQGNLEAFNGVVHIIDAVLMPDFDVIPATG